MGVERSLIQELRGRRVMERKHLHHPQLWMMKKRKKRRKTRKRKFGKQMLQRDGVTINLWKWNRHQRTKTSWWLPTVMTSGMRMQLPEPGDEEDTVEDRINILGAGKMKMPMSNQLQQSPCH